MSTKYVYSSTSTSTHFSDNKREEGNMDINKGTLPTTGPTFVRHKDGGIPPQALTFTIATNRHAVAATRTLSPKESQASRYPLERALT